MLTHRNFVANARSIVSYLRPDRARPRDVRAAVLLRLRAVAAAHAPRGRRLGRDRQPFAFPNVVLRAMQEHAVTGFAGVPSTFALLLHRSDLDVDAAARRCATSRRPAARCRSRRIQEWLARGPNVPFYVMYGATEASARLTYPRSGAPARQAGLDRQGDSERRDPDRQGRRQPSPRRARSASWSRAARTSRSGYWNNPEETAREVRSARLSHRRSRLRRRRRLSVPGRPPPRHDQGRRASRRRQGDRGRPARVPGRARSRRRRHAARPARRGAGRVRVVARRRRG